MRLADYLFLCDFMRRLLGSRVSAQVIAIVREAYEEKVDGEEIDVRYEWVWIWQSDEKLRTDFFGLSSDQYTQEASMVRLWNDFNG